MEKEKVEGSVKIVNVVASATLNQKINLKSIIRRFPSARFPSEQFPGVMFRLRRPKTTALIFRSGKIICAGGKTEEEAYKAINCIVMRLIKNRIITSERPEYKVNNIVASANLGRPVDLASISSWQKSMYEPEQFPALIYQMEDPKVVFLIFSSGRVICLGAKTEDRIYEAIRRLFQKLNLGGAFRSPSLNKIEMEERESFSKGSSAYKLKLKEFILSDSLGRACPHIEGLWCRCKLCDGPACKYANLIQAKLVNGVYGCWGFHWHEGFYTEQAKREQRKFFD